MPLAIAERPWMPGYGVPTDAGDVLPWEWAEERLVACHNYWVVTVSAEGQPHSLPVWGVWLEDRFAFSCGEQSRKARNIQSNPRVTVTNADTVEVVSVQGAAAYTTDAGRRSAVVRAYVAKYTSDTNEAKELSDLVGGHPLLEVTPARAFGIIERHDEFLSRATRWRWLPS